ncbi:MAG: hypothetical protein DMF95_16615, partial [Acidobacteria bacterium]
MNLSEWYRARRRLYETGAFRRVDIEPEPISPDDGTAEAAPYVAAPYVTEQPMRARVTLEEWVPVRLRYGLELNDQSKESSAARL